VSAIVPYVAPWQTEFNQYSVQNYTPTNPFFNVLAMTIPSGQWWRIIYLLGVATTSAAVMTRTAFMQVTDATGRVTFKEIAPVSQPASSTYSYLYGPSLNAYANTTDPTAGQAVSVLPDLLLAPLSVVELALGNVDASDSWGNTGVFSIEVYTEDRESDTLQPIAAPLIP